MANFDTVLASLQDVSDSSKLMKLLIDIRKRVDGDCPKNKDNIIRIREKGAFKQIIVCLHSSKKGIINISLSILGNCCLDSKCAKDVICQFGILSSLNQLLKRYPKEDSMNGRVFRVLGNLCLHREQWAVSIINKKPQIVIHVIKYLTDSVDEESGTVSDATVAMGVRSLRELVNRETLELLVEKHEVLKTVGMLLIKYGTVWEEKKKGEGVLINIVKLLHEYSRYRFYPSILQMRNTTKGDSTLYLSKILLLAPRQVVKIVMNFLKISVLKSDLPIPEIFNSFLEVLRNDSIIQEFNSTCEECIKCLCHMLDHPGNRENERCGDSIPILVNVLKGLTFEHNRKIECCLLIISTLNKCKYNQSLIAKQVDCNIVTVLTEKLKFMVGTVYPLVLNHKSDKKRKTNVLAKYRKLKRHRSSDDHNEYFYMDEELSSSSSSEDEEIDKLYFGRMRYDHSPVSSNESEMAMSWTSGLSPQSSPRSQVFGLSESDSDDYSPVCSEVDANDFALPMEDEDFTNPELESTDAYVLADDEELPSFDLDSTPIRQIKVKMIMEIVDLIKTYVRIKPPVNDLGTPELLLGLIKSSGYFDWPNSSAILDIVDVICRILESHVYLLPLMKSNFIPGVFDLSKIQHGAWCSRCRQFQWMSNSILKKLSKVAESGGGKGDIAHKLLRGDSATKQQLVLTIPYVITNRSVLTKFMINCGGLNILMDLLLEQAPLRTKSIKTLCALAAKNLTIPNPKKTCYKSNIFKTEPCNSSSSVTFKLDDGSLLSADRELLSKNSDFFARLLNGDFKESSQDVITLPNVTNKALTYLLKFISCDIDKTELIEVEVDLDTHLDVIGLCDRFLMEEFRGYLVDCVEKFRLNHDTIPVIYNWALESKTNLLRVESIAYALVCNISDSERFEMFKNLFELGYNDELVGDIKGLLVRYMNLKEECQCKKKRRKLYLY